MKLILLTVSITALLAGCSQAAPQAAAPEVVKLPTTSMEIKGKPYTLEVADDPDEQEKGMMYRTEVPDGTGMIFVFKDEQVRGFWMQNVPITLDIAYLDRNGVVLTVLTMYPMDITPRSSVKPAQYAVEIAGGVAAKINLKPGDVLTIPESIKPKPPAK